MSESQEEGQQQDYSVDQLAGAVVLVLGAIAGLLQVIWMSKCHCKVNLCYIFRCERRPPTEEEMKTLKTKAGELKDKNKPGTPPDSGAKEPEPEPEPELEPQSTSLVPTRP